MLVEQEALLPLPAPTRIQKALSAGSTSRERERSAAGSGGWWVSVVGIALLLAMCPSAAKAAHGPPGGVYAGRVVSQNSTILRPVSLQLSANGRELKRFVFYAAIPCQGMADGFAITVEEGSSPGDRVRIGRGGVFADRSPVQGDLGGPDRLKLTALIRGRVRPRAARVTWRLMGALVDPSGAVIARCDTGTVAYELSRGESYGGVTSQQDPLVIVLNQARTRIRSFLIQIDGDCGAAGSLTLAIPADDIAVKKDGRFSKTVLSGLPYPVGGGWRLQGQLTVRGRLRAHSASGSFRAIGTLFDPNGNKSGCTTPRIRWTAARR